MAAALPASSRPEGKRKAPRFRPAAASPRGRPARAAGGGAFASPLPARRGPQREGGSCSCRAGEGGRGWRPAASPSPLSAGNGKPGVWSVGTLPAGVKRRRYGQAKARPLLLCHARATASVKIVCIQSIYIVRKQRKLNYFPQRYVSAV